MKKILIISSNRLGDAILSSGLNKFFKEKNYNITYVCGPLPFNLFKYCRNIDNILSLKKKKSIPLIGFIYGVKFSLIFGIVLLILEEVLLVFFYLPEKDLFIKI